MTGSNIYQFVTSAKMEARSSEQNKKLQEDQSAATLG